MAISAILMAFSAISMAISAILMAFSAILMATCFHTHVPILLNLGIIPDRSEAREEGGYLARE